MPHVPKLSRFEYKKNWNIQEIALYISFSDCKQFIVKFPTSQITIKLGFIEISLVLVDNYEAECFMLSVVFN